MRSIYDPLVPSSVDRQHFRPITPGVETLPRSFSLPRHRHLHAYATVVLAGEFEESGYAGRIRATAGDVLIHASLDCHANMMVFAGVKLIRLYWRDISGMGGLFRLDDVDEIARTAERDVVEASRLSEARVRLPPGRGTIGLTCCLQTSLRVL
jgi:hypothetical protein